METKFRIRGSGGHLHRHIEKYEPKVEVAPEPTKAPVEKTTLGAVSKREQAAHRKSVLKNKFQRANE
jgi:hypothetical protein